MKGFASRHSKPGEPCEYCENARRLQAMLFATGAAVPYRAPGWFGAPGQSEDLGPVALLALELLVIAPRGMA